MHLLPRSSVRPITQIKGYCGPTAVSMLVEALGKRFTPIEIGEATGVSESIAAEGTLITELAKAISVLDVELAVMSKFDCTLEDVASLCNNLGIPVGVEWQCSFFDASINKIFSEGHYSIVTKIDFMNNELAIVDPDTSSVYYGRSIHAADFLDRWWETNIVRMPDDSTCEVTNRAHAFVVCGATEIPTFGALGFSRPSNELLLQHHIAGSSRR